MSKKQFRELIYKSNFLKGISQRTLDIHHGKLYKGYVDKTNEISEKLGELRRLEMEVDPEIIVKAIVGFFR